MFQSLYSYVLSVPFEMNKRDQKGIQLSTQME